jgi:hypothetical protein
VEPTGRLEELNVKAVFPVPEIVGVEVREAPLEELPETYPVKERPVGRLSVKLGVRVVEYSFLRVRVMSNGMSTDSGLVAERKAWIV